VARAGQVIKGPGGFELLLVRTGAETDGELLEMEATYPGSDTLPPEHLHPQQTERFEVLEGNIRAIIDGSERRYEAGEVFEVQPGTPHQLGAEEPARMRWETRPALRTAEFFDRLFGDGPDSASAAESIPEFFAEFGDEFRLTAG
jgi:quercetin dioxygenase-like cupin family protein